jgi:hypothetical protein
LVEFQTPWPLLPTTSGIEARDIRSTESAFVQVVPAIVNWKDRKVFRELLIDSVFASQGKFGAYGTPTDIKVKPLKDKDETVFSVTFTSYTTGMRESEGKLAPCRLGRTRDVCGDYRTLRLISSHRSITTFEDSIIDDNANCSISMME